MKKTLIAFAVAMFAVSAYAQSSVTLGDNSSANQEGVAVGGGDTGWGPNGPLAGGTARLNIAGEYAAAFGYASQAQGRGDTAIGTYANTGAPSPLGASDDSQDSYRTAVGYKANATGEVALALGSFTSATGLGSVALGYGSTDGGQAMVVSVGGNGVTRQIINVTAGNVNATSTDAVNGSQLYTVQQAAAQAETDAQKAITSAAQSGAAAAAANSTAVTANETATAAAAAAASAKATATAAGTAAAAAGNAATAAGAAAAAGTVAVTKEASRATAAEATLSAGVSSEATRAKTAEAGLQAQEASDASAIVAEANQRVVDNAATMSSANAYTNQSAAITLGQANAYTDQQFNQAESDISKLRSDMYGGVASALAVAGLPQPTGPGKSMVSVAGSTYHGATGFAAGYSRVSQDDKWVMKASITTNSRGDFGAVVSAGRQF